MRSGPVSIVTRCSPRRRRPRTVGSRCRRSWAKSHERGAVTAHQIATDVRAGRRSAREVLAEHLERVHEREGELHAFNLVMEDDARAAAAGIDERVAAGDDAGPLAAVPVALKDNFATRRIPTTYSSRILEGWCPPYD